jgi:Na+/melibiose symporter-like transporter
VANVDVANVALLAGGAGALALALRHFGHAVDPMLRLHAMRVPTFRAVLRGGSLARMAIGSAPFLLTLMFQVGFGYDAFKAGYLVLFLFAGNLLMKTVTTPILRRVGYRPVLVWNGVLAAASLGLCATLQPASSIWWVGGVLLANGITRSMHFTALATVSFADIGKEDMSDANGLSNTVGQLAMAAGITLATMAVHAGQLVTVRDAASYPAYQFAFGVLALVTLASVIEMALLPKGAGDHFIARK